MKTIELVKSKIEILNREVDNYKDIESSCPRMKRQIVNGKMSWILQNPETLTWAIISEDEVKELNNLYHIAKYGITQNDDPFLFHK